jgi:hypothetical protein
VEAEVDWRALTQLILSYPKRPVRAKVVMESELESRRADIVHDGHRAWYINDGSRVEITGDNSTMLVQGDELHCIRGMGVAVNNWAKSMIQGRLVAYLGDASGTVVGRELVEGRPCWIADVVGLRRDQSTSFRLWIDEETGMILRLTRAEPPPRQVRLTELTFGSLEEPLFG